MYTFSAPFASSAFAIINPMPVEIVSSIFFTTLTGVSALPVPPPVISATVPCTEKRVTGSTTGVDSTISQYFLCSELVVALCPEEGVGTSVPVQQKQRQRPRHGNMMCEALTPHRRVTSFNQTTDSWS